MRRLCTMMTLICALSCCAQVAGAQSFWGGQQQNGQSSASNSISPWQFLRFSTDRLQLQQSGRINLRSSYQQPGSYQQPTQQYPQAIRYPEYSQNASLRQTYGWSGRNGAASYGDNSGTASTFNVQNLHNDYDSAIRKLNSGQIRVSQDPIITGGQSYNYPANNGDRSTYPTVVAPSPDQQTRKNIILRHINAPDY